MIFDKQHLVIIESLEPNEASSREGRWHLCWDKFADITFAKDRLEGNKEC